MPAYLEAFSDRTVELPMDADVLADHQALAYVNGIVKVPDDHRVKGADGNERHGDTAIAGALMYFASRQSGGGFGAELTGQTSQSAQIMEAFTGHQASESPRADYSEFNRM